MSFENWSSLQESDIQGLTSSKVFARGRALFDEGALEELSRRDDTISALCQGSDDDAYALSARVAEERVQETRCSCPYAYEGLCKHLVALLLAWAHTPEAFAEVAKAVKEKAPSGLLAELQGRERDELAHLIVQLVETEPKMRAVVKRLLRARLSEGDVAKTQKAVEAQLRKIARAGYDGYSFNFASIRKEINFHLRSAASLEAMRPNDAGRLYTAILKGILNLGSEPFEWDNNGNLSDISEQCITALSGLLPRVTAALRGEFLTVLCDAYLFDLKSGGCGYTAGADDALESANAQEWPAIEARLDKEFPGRPASRFSGADYSSDWGYTNIVELKASRLEKWEGASAANAFLMKHGTPEQQVRALVQMGDFETAVHQARQNFGSSPGLIQSFADQLNEAGQWERARAWAQQNRLMEWLARQSALRGEADALPLNLEVFRHRPSASQWSRVLQVAPEAKHAALRAEMWALLEKQKEIEIQFDIRLQEGEVREALQIWPRLKRWDQRMRHGQLTTTAEKSPVDDALLLWDEIAESLIEQRSRDAYRLAAKALLRAKKALEEAGRGAQWPERSAAIRARYPTLRALKEELDGLKL